MNPDEVAIEAFKEAVTSGTGGAGQATYGGSGLDEDEDEEEKDCGEEHEDEDETAEKAAARALGVLKGRVYIDDPSDAPADAEVQEGEQGGLYYETGSSDYADEGLGEDYADLPEFDGFEPGQTVQYESWDGEVREQEVLGFGQNDSNDPRLVLPAPEDSHSEHVLIDPSAVQVVDDGGEEGWVPHINEQGDRGYLNTETGEFAGSAREPPEDAEPYVPDTNEKAADAAAEAAIKVLPRGDTGNGGTAEKADSTLSTEEYERCDGVLKEMHANLAQWEGEDLSKAPPAWTGDEDIPQFVFEAIKEAIGEGVVWDKFEGYSRQAAQAIRNSLEDNLTQPQGWSIGSVVDDLTDMYPGMEQGKALNIAQTEVSAILNTAREDAYEQREDSDDYVYYWQGPNDHRTTEVCAEIEEEVEARGGSVPLEELRQILMAKAEKYEGTREGGTPERVDEWMPHYQCRRTFIRDVKADL